MAPCLRYPQVVTANYHGSETIHLAADPELNPELVASSAAPLLLPDKSEDVL
jgi:hypothetical protein